MEMKTVYDLVSAKYHHVHSLCSYSAELSIRNDHYKQARNRGYGYRGLDQHFALYTGIESTTKTLTHLLKP